MNKTLSIALAGYSFMIEEHAYIKLNDYLMALRSSLEADEAEEVMHDIEIRMVEIFRDLLGKREVLNNEDVEKVIAQIGTPEAIEEQEEAYYSEAGTKAKMHTYANQDIKKQLFKDPENAKIAGVCAGLAHYTNMDISWMRIIWVGLALLGLFTGISTLFIVIAYIILWAVLPTASSASDYLKMQGKPVNFDTIKEESGKLMQFANESTQKVGQFYKENQKHISSAGSGFANVLRIFFGGLFGLMSVGMIVGFFFLLFISLGNSNFPLVSIMDYYFEDGSMRYLLLSIAMLGTLIPALICAVFSVKLLSPKTKIKNVGWVILGLIIALLASSVYFGLSMAKKDLLFRGYKEDTEEIAISTTSDTLFVDLKQVEIPQNFRGYDDDIYSDKKVVYEEDRPYVVITRKADVKSPYLVIKKEAKGYNHPINLSVSLDVVDNKISLPNFIKYPYADRFRDYGVEYELIVPQSTTIIPVKQKEMHFRGDLDNDPNNNSDEDNDWDDYDDYDKNRIIISNDGITINGKTITNEKTKGDSVAIDGKLYHKKEAKRILDSVARDLKGKKGKDMEIRITAGSDKSNSK